METMMILKKRLMDDAKTILIIFLISFSILFMAISDVKYAPVQASHSSSPSPFYTIYRKISPFPQIVEQTIESVDISIDDQIIEEPQVIEDDTIVDIDDPTQLYISYVHEICKEEDIPNLENIVIAMIYHESRFIPTLKNGKCVGLMQVSTYWHSDRAERLGIDDMFDPYSNILIGVDILKDLYYNYTNEDITLAVMMYNMDFSQARKIYNSGNISIYAKNVFDTASCWEEVI